MSSVTKILGCIMSRTLHISDELYKRLEANARERGFANVERMLEDQGGNGFDAQQRQDAVRGIDDLRKLLASKYGEMPDSTDSIRNDRAR